MKLFKKLAAAMLVAALALTMVGCGAGGTGSALDLKNEVLNLIEDDYYLGGKTATHTTAMDTAAAALIEKAAADETAKDENVTVKELLEKQTIEGKYIAIFAPYTQLRTEMWQQNYVYDMQGALDWATDSDHYQDSSYKKMVAEIGTPAVGEDDSIEMGAAMGTIKGKNYLVLLVKKAA